MLTQRMLLSAVLTLLLAACGGAAAPAAPSSAPPAKPAASVAPAGSASASPAAPSVASPSTAAQPAASAAAAAKTGALTKVPVILNWVIDATYSIYLYGTEKGFFRDQGIELDMTPGRGSDFAQQQINENKFQFAFTDLLTYLAQRAKGQTPTTAVMSHIEVPTMSLVSTKPIKTPQDLSGKTFGTVSFSSGRFLLPLTLQSNKVDPNTVKIELMDVSVLYPSLFEGKIDSAEAHITGTLAGTMIAAQKAGKPLNYVLLQDWGLIGYAKMMIVRDEVLKSNPDLVKRLVTAMVRSNNEARAKASDDEIVGLLTKSQPQYSKDEALLQWQQYKQIVKNPGAFDPKVVQANLDYIAQGQNIKTDLKPEQLFTNEFVPKS